ncbi:MAG TPA: CBS domain-containing protein [Conexibacter sp.]|jgi:CBS domain-containing protein
MTLLTELDGLTAADVIHPRLSSLPASATIAEVRDFFAASSSRRLAVFADGERFVGSIEVDAPSLSADPADAASAHAAQGPTIAPDASAVAARDLALAQPSRRVPVVDDGGRLLGVVAIDKHLQRFCGV